MPPPLLSLPLAELAEPVRFRSRILGEEVWIVPDRYAGPPLAGCTYTVSECLLLLAMVPDPDQLRAIHRARVLFDADLVPDVDRGAARQAYGEAMARYRRLARALAADAGEAEAAELLAAARALSDLMNQVDDP